MSFRRPGSHPDELISASLSGDLSAAERHELEQHLASCESCRETLAAFSDERRLLAGLAHAQAPRDLAVRVQSGIDGGRFSAGSWWWRPGGILTLGASMATVAAALLAVVIIGNLNPGPVGHSNSPAASPSALPSASLAASPLPSLEPTPEPGIALGPGELGYLSLNGAPLEAGRLTFNNDATGASLSLGTASGPPLAASLSPDGQWLAYITQLGETGANKVWALHLTDGNVVPLGCSFAVPFTDRLAWSPDSGFLAFTLATVDLGPSGDCPENDGPEGTDAWVFDTGSGERGNITYAGNAYAASWVTAAFGEGSHTTRLLVSWAARSPSSAAVIPFSDADFAPIEGVFLPLMSPDLSRAIFWSGTMAQNADGSWRFSQGGMPQLSGDFRSASPASPWLGTPLFSDLTLVGGEGFAYGSLVWGPDSDQIAFWNGAWTGAPQGADGIYPSQRDLYRGRVSGGLLSADSIIRPKDDNWIVAVVFGPDGSTAITTGIPSAGVGDPPSADLSFGGETIGGGVDPPPWIGPAVFVP